MSKKPSAESVANLAAENEVLAKANEAALQKLEKAIQKGEDAFFTAARAVVEIIDKELFKPSFANKTAYFRDRWSMTPQNLTRYVNTGRLLLILDVGVEAGDFKLPKNEGQCRELYKQGGGKVEAIVPIWKSVSNSGEEITAKLIADTAAQVLPTQANSDGTAQTAAAKSPNQVPSNILAVSPAKKSATLRLKVQMQEGWGTAFDFEGSPFKPVGDGEYEIIIEGKSNKDLLERLASWDKVENVELALITFN